MSLGDFTDRRIAPAIRPYRRQWLRGDILAGLAAGAVVIPQAMAYATVAEMPVQVGLYTCMLPLVVYAFIGGSRTASVTTTSTIATLTASAMVAAGIAADSPDRQARLTTLTLMVGVILLAARLLRLASVVENISAATVVGIKAGVGLTVAATQLPKLFGLPTESAESGFFRTLWSVVGQLERANVATVLLAAGCIALLLLVAKYIPAIPGPLVVVVISIALAAFTPLTERGVPLIPEVPQGIPMPQLPDLTHVGALIPSALAIALMAFLETVSVARGVRRADEPRIDPDRELSATGLAALVSGLFQALPPAAGFSQTGVNLRCGARSQLAGLVTAALAVVTALYFAPVLGLLPQATLGAMVLVATLGLIDLGALIALYRFDKVEFALALTVTAFGLFFGLLPAVAVGVVLTLYLVLREINHAHVAQVVRHDDEAWVELNENSPLRPATPTVLRFGVGLYAANMQSNAVAVHSLILAADPRPSEVLLDLSRLPRISSTVLGGLRDLEEDLRRDGVQVWYTALRESVRATARRWPWWEQVESEGRYFDDLDDAASDRR
ncbi:SulP family inorganic anion transporter [Mycolicibacterium sp. F2034L]|uniref:SulP family inorganic anion transporter n=1 Tax=Mycolicibacterium sp. F2034L TaxID=2926422 RepID=UPI001FF3417D|nr:SulP family inorganic anion transporter [Mycolicibacterium sp. F2034L]MCK0172980.1 SulP family inorganic anion transporter [Mycolicibacterium sp. F2034L]